MNIARAKATQLPANAYNFSSQDYYGYRDVDDKHAHPAHVYLGLGIGYHTPDRRKPLIR